MKRYLVFSCLVSLILACSGIERQPVSIRADRRDISVENYDDILKRVTRKAVVIRELDTNLHVYATWMTPEFNSVHTAKIRNLFMLPESSVRQLQKERHDAWQNSYSFMIGAATNDASWNDFDRKKSQWRLVLSSGSASQVQPLRIERINPISSADRVLYPYLEVFYYLYRVDFPKTYEDGSPVIGSTTDHLVLSITGGLGHADLQWRLR